jgi:nucleoside-diphosphate-sugar epimerase
MDNLCFEEICAERMEVIMKIAVTGASGLVGKYVVQELAEHQYDVLLINHHHDGLRHPQKVIDVRDFEAVKECLKGCEAVIQLAGIASPKGDMDSSVFENNLIGDYNIVLAAGLNGITRVALASSDCAVGLTWSQRDIKRVDYLPMDEEHPARPDNGYGIAKLLSEKMCDCMSIRFPEMSISNLRISHTAQPEDYLESSYFYACINDPEKGPRNLWSYIDSRDSAQAFRLAIEKKIIGHQVYYIAAKKTRCKVPSIDLIKKYYPNAELKAPFTGYESLENTKKAETLLGFKAKYSWDD